MLDLKNGEEFFDMASGREMLIKQWSGQPWLFYRHPDGDWVSERPATEEDLALLDAAYQEARRRPHQLAKSYAQVLPTRRDES